MVRAKDATVERIHWLGKRSSARVVPTKSNPLQQTWFIPHDVAGLIELMEEPKSFHASRAKFTDGTWLPLNRILPIRLDSIPKTLNEAEPTCATCQFATDWSDRSRSTSRDDRILAHCNALNPKKVCVLAVESFGSDQLYLHQLFR
jgi:hypothetical protein